MAKKAPKLPTTTNGFISRWRRSFKISRDRATNLYCDREVYREYERIIVANPNLDLRAEFFHLVRNMYVSHVLVAIRSLTDFNPKSHSLWGLMKEIRDNATQLKREWFARRYRKYKVGVFPKPIGNDIFRREWGKLTYVDPKRVDRDMRRLLTLCHRIRLVVNKQIAHNDRRKPASVKKLTFGEVDKAIDGIFDLVDRYNVLLFGPNWGTPLVLPSAHVFQLPWIDAK